jgi:hypothetical protein
MRATKQLARTSGDPKAAAKSLEKERKAQLERLDKRIAATQKAGEVASAGAPRTMRGGLGITSRPSRCARSAPARGRS